MNTYPPEKIRNLVLLGAAGSGKTTLAETMMFEGGVIKRRGSVDEGNTMSDSHPLEKEKKHSYFLTLLHTDWRGHKLNILDTPGYDDFIEAILAGAKAADNVLLVVNAQHGMEVGSEILWRYVEPFNRPAVIVVNQLDHEKANWEETLESIKHKFGDKAVVMQYPVNPGTGFNKIVDLLKMTMYAFGPDGGKPEKKDIPPEEQERAGELHNQLVEMAAINDDSLMEKYFEQGELSEDEMREGIRKGMLAGDIIPIFCVSAARNMGSGRLMSFISNVTPSAKDAHPWKTEDGKEIVGQPDGDPILFVFKTHLEHHVGKISYFRTVSGVVHAGDELLNTTTDEKEKLPQIYSPNGKERTAVPAIPVGDIGAAVKLKNTHTNNTLTKGGNKVRIEPIPFPQPRIRVALEVVKQGEEEKLAAALHALTEEDPTLIVEHSHELKQIILYGQGELHLGLAAWRIQHEFGVEVKFVEPKIPYRETIRGEGRAQYRHKKQSGGAGQFGEVHLYVEPHDENRPEKSDFPIRGKEEIDLEWGGKLVFYNCIVGGAIDAKFMPSILKGILGKMRDGLLIGSPVRDVRVYVYDGKMHPVDSNDISFQIAGAQAFRQAFEQAQPIVLEPIYEVTVYVPEAMLGDVMTDLQSRRAMIMGIEADKNFQRIRAEVPLSELYKYSNTLRSLTQGRATHTRRFLRYQPVPGDVQQKLLKEAAASA